MSEEFQARQDYVRQLRHARSKFRRLHSLDLIPENPSQEESDDEDIATPTLSRSNTGINKNILPNRNPPDLTFGIRICNVLLFWPNLVTNLVILILRYMLYIPLSIAAPSFWLSALLWIFWKILRLPLEIFKGIFSASISTHHEFGAQNGPPKRTVLISCGSTIQTLHLARNFFSSGARVVVFEFDELFGLARFSSAVDKFYAVPKASPHNVEKYIATLCHIVRKEKPSVYIPVCATSPAYYDAAAKPHLELLGCATFMTGVQETLILDDCLQFYQRCAAQDIELPPYVALSSPRELWELYERGFIQQFRNILVAVGMQGILERFKYMLPRQISDFRFFHEISEQQQWLVVRDVPGQHYVTCTTVKSSNVVANVTCRVEQDTKNLIPVPLSASNTTADSILIDNWLKAFFSKVRFQRPINCHISFRLVKSQTTGQFLPLGIRLGVSLPYICYNRSHAQILCRTMKCVHMRPLTLLATNEEESSLASLTAQWCSLEATSAAVPLDKREALFTYWDPLPYCAYYHFQLPLESVKTFLQKRYKTKVKSPRLTIRAVN